MARLYLFAEGPTELTFADTMLKPHPADFGVYLHPPVLIAHAKKKGKVHRGGGRKYMPMKNDILRFLAQEKDGFFIGDAELKTEIPDNLMNKGLSAYVKSSAQVLFSDSEMERFDQKPGQVKDGDISTRQHVQSLIKNIFRYLFCPKVVVSQCKMPLPCVSLFISLTPRDDFSMLDTSGAHESLIGNPVKIGDGPAAVIGDEHCTVSHFFPSRESGRRSQ